MNVKLPICVFTGAGGSAGRGSGSGSGGRARSDPTHQNTSAQHSIGHQHQNSAGAMDYEPVSGHQAAPHLTWASADITNAPGGVHPSGGIHGHAHTFPHAHRKHHHSHVSPGQTKLSQSATLPNQIPPTTNLSSASGVTIPHVHMGSGSSSGGPYVYPQHSNLDCTTSGSMNMPLGGFRTSGHPPNIHKPQTLPAAVPHTHVPTTHSSSGGSGSVSYASATAAASSSAGYGYSISAQATVNPAIVSTQGGNTRQGEESPMHGVCVQQSPVASH